VESFQNSQKKRGVEMSLARKIKRKQRAKLKKEMRKKSRDIEKKISGMPENCDECSAPFDKTDTESLNKWKIAVYDDGPIHLVCPACVPPDIGGE
tara:strand:+ start:49 stop:333 length:285 start_codon:yes stop_codon:yes gene_type:complete